MNEVWGIGGALGSSLLWAFSSVLFQRSLAKQGAFALSLFKASVGGVLFWVTTLVLAASGDVAVTGSTGVVLLLVSGVVGMAAGDFAYFASMERIGVRQSTLLHGTAPIFLLIFGFFDRTETLTVLEVIGVLLVVGGVLDVTRHQGRARARLHGPRYMHGILYGLGAALGQAGGIVLARDALRECHFMFGAAVRLTGAVLGLLVIVVLARRGRSATRIFTSGEVWRTSMLPVFTGTYLGVACMMLAIIHSKTAVAGALLSMTPVFVVPLSWLMLKERFDLRILVGTSVAVGGVIVVSL